MTRFRRVFPALGIMVLALASAAGTARAQEVEITVDLAKPGAAIDPYLYGQFLEHLGRCIRDGVWAEKLRDRKFLLATGKTWETILPKGAVADVFHDTAGAYAGDHCMAIWARDPKGECGIRQGGIGLVAGKDYVGYAVLAQIGDPAPVKVRLAWGATEVLGQTALIGNVGRDYVKFPFQFRAGATTDSAVLSLTVAQPCYVWVAGLSLMPADNVKGMRADTLELIRRLKPPVTRWPGGNFVSGYRWQDAIGDRDRRPPRVERAWNDVEDNDFGIDEFMTFCDTMKTDAYIAVNTGLGSAEDAAAEVEYATGPATSRWGAERAKNGHPEPYRVALWGIGNEMFGDWQLGHIAVERDAARHNAFVQAMRAKNPTVKAVAVGSPGAWNDAFVPACAKNMDLLSGHHYTERKVRLPMTPADARKYEHDFVVYSDKVAGGVRNLVNDFRKRLDARHMARVRLAIDEWGIVRDWNPAPDGPGLGSFEHYFCLGDAIAVTRGLHEILRAADVVSMANWAQTVNVIGTIKTSRTQSVLDPAGHVMALYREHVGGTLVPIEVKGEGLVDAVAAWDQAASRLNLGLVNYSPNRAAPATFWLSGPLKVKTLAAWRIAGPTLTATNVPGQPESVTTAPLAGLKTLDKSIVLPPRTITVIEAIMASPQ